MPRAGGLPMGWIRRPARWQMAREIATEGATLTRRHFMKLVGVLAAAAAVSVIVPALRRSAAEDATRPAPRSLLATPGWGRPESSLAPAPTLAATPTLAPEPTLPPMQAPMALAQLPAVEAPTPAEGTEGVNPTARSENAPPVATNPAAVETALLQLRTLSAEQLHARLEQIFGRPAPLMPADGSAWTRFSVDTGDGAPVLVAVQPQTSEVRILGRADQLRVWRELIAAIDAPAAPDQSREIIVADAKSGPQIRKTAELLLAQAAVPAGPDAASGTIAGIPEGLLGPVEIVNIEGTELFIVQGNPRDVERAMQVIRQIQELSRVSAPVLVMRPLANIDSQAAANLLSQLFAPPGEDGGSTLGSYYGRLVTLPMGRPNAILLLGAASPVEKAQEILQQLDSPAAAQSTQFEVFRLKHAQAEAAQSVVESLFMGDDNAGGVAGTFGPKALVIAELRTNALIVRAAPADMAEVRALIAELDAPGGEAVNELRVFKLKHSLASTLAPVLQRAVRGEGNDSTAATEGLATLLRMVTIDAQGRQQLASGVLAGVTVNADTRANALVVSAPPESMSLMEALITQLDQPPDAVAELKVFTIKNGDAVALAEMLQELFGTPQQGGGGGPGGGGGQAANTDVFQLRFSVDERTNSIIAAGSADELLVVDAILLRLDSGASRSRVNRVYRLKNASAADVGLALQEWLEQKREVELTAPGETSPFSQIEREVVVVAEPASNSLIVSATPSYYEELEGIVQQLDEQAPMVMIQVLIGEIRLGDADEFGVELGLQDSVLFDRSLLSDIQNITTTTQTQSPGGAVTNVTQQVVQTASLTPGFNFGNPQLGLPNSGSNTSLASAAAVGAQGVSSFAVNRVSPDLGFGGMVLAASSDSVSALLRALQESRRVEVLSRPQIMALDNQFGRAFVGEIVPIITDSQVIGLTGQTQNTVTPTNVGLELLVRPRISPDDLVVMEVSAAKRELGPIDQGVPVAISPTGDPINVPRIASTEAQTTVSAMSGQTVVLSGLLTKRDEALHRRVPLLADIPLVGALFRFDSSRQVRTELLIVLTPQVIRSRLQSDRLKQVESARMNWCLSDVVEMHGAVGLRSRTDLLGAAQAEEVYPNMTREEMGQVMTAEPQPGLENIPTPVGGEMYLAPPTQPMPAP
jgi:general secretion pathway protein D